MRCEACRGHGSHRGLEVETCAECQQGEMACQRHKCRRCDGSGMVCPACCGDRMLQVHEWSEDETTVQVKRCPTCTEGNNVNANKERLAIMRYLTTWLQTTATKESEATP